MSAVIDYAAKPPVMRCTDCGATMDFKLPMDLDKAAQVARTFDAKHKRCWIDQQTRPKT